MSKASKKPVKKSPGLFRRTIRSCFKWSVRAFVLLVLLILALRWINPPATPYMIAEYLRHGTLTREWVALSDMSQEIPLAVVAAEDANFCSHFGFDVTAIQNVIASGTAGGASTITQQTAKNLFLWQGRSWVRKGFEAGFTILLELLWPKERILEVYLNIAEFDTATFGAAAGAKRYFNKDAASLSAFQASRLATVLPNPKPRSADRLSAAHSRRARSIADGAATIGADGRANCFLP